MTSIAKALRLDDDTWRWLEWRSSWWAGTSIVLGAFMLLAYNRFGWPDFALRETVRFLLVGLYGWLWLAGASGVAGRLFYGIRQPFPTLVRLVGHAHLPVLAVGLATLLLSSFNIANVAGWVAGFAGAFWMPAMLANAVAAWGELELTRAIRIVVIPHLVWVGIVGRYVWIQLAHLL